jgi:hypothetical protein
MAFSIMAAMPSAFWFPGNSPSEWLNDLVQNRPLSESLAEQLGYYSEMIAANDHLMRRNSTQMKIGIWLAWGGMTAGGVLAISVLAWNDGLVRSLFLPMSPELSPQS